MSHAARRMQRTYDLRGGRGGELWCPRRAQAWSSAQAGAARQLSRSAGQRSPIGTRGSPYRVVGQRTWSPGPPAVTPQLLVRWQVVPIIRLEEPVQRYLSHGLRPVSRGQRGRDRARQPREPVWCDDRQRNLVLHAAAGHRLRPAFVRLAVLSAAPAGLSRDDRRLIGHSRRSRLSPRRPALERARLRRRPGGRPRPGLGAPTGGTRTPWGTRHAAHHQAPA
jgi:hypothetical protein